MAQFKTVRTLKIMLSKKFVRFIDVNPSAYRNFPLYVARRLSLQTTLAEVSPFKTDLTNESPESLIQNGTCRTNKNVHGINGVESATYHVPRQ